jgi:hypothetical protein
MNEWRPVPKPEKREKKKTGLKKIKPYNRKTPKPKKKKAPKKQAVISAERSGIKPPSTKSRNDFSDKEREIIVEQFGETCNDPTCGLPACEHHHIMYRSQSGRGMWRNAVPLCISHHEKCHRDRRYSDMWREARRRQFGEHYYRDKWDLWLDGLIAEPEDHFFEDFMKNQERSMSYEKEVPSRKERRHSRTLEQLRQERIDAANE